MKSYDTLSEAVEDLKKRGYQLDFDLKPDGLESKDPKMTLRPEEFMVDEFYRFEGDSNPADASVVYAISASNKLKGLIIDAYGAYAESLSFEMLHKLKMK